MDSQGIPMHQLLREPWSIGANTKHIHGLQRIMQKQTIHITTEDGYRMKILFYRPDGTTGSLTTGVLWIHGGGYITGMASMAGMMGMGPRLVKDHGCVVISPEHRLGKKGGYPNASFKAALSIYGHDVRTSGKKSVEGWLKKLGF